MAAGTNNQGAGPRMNQEARQQMSMLPRMLQSIEVLHLGAQDLEAWLHDAAEQNEALRVEEPTHSEPGLRGAEGVAASDRHEAMLRNQPDREPRIGERVEAQLAMLDLDADGRAWIHYLCSCLDEGGYLSLGDEDLLRGAAEAGLPPDPEALERALEVLRGLEPRGLGARNAVEALVLQLDERDPDYALLRRLLDEFLEDLARNKLPQVARAMDLGIDDLQSLLARLGDLNSRPAAELAATPAPRLRPDILILPRGDEFEVSLERSSQPSVAVDPDLEALARDRTQDPEVRRYLRGKIDRARGVVDAVEARGATLLRIAVRVAAHQGAFLREGPGHLEPLRMGQVADELEVHTSTVSRAVAGTYVQTPFGIYPLRHFFQASAGTPKRGRADSAGGAKRAVGEVREALRELIASEDPGSPLSDDELVGRLAEQGIQLARRSVAKHRGDLGIQSSYRRRRYGTGPGSR